MTSWGEMGAAASGRWWQWHGGRQGPWLIADGASLPHHRCARPHHRSCSSRRWCHLRRRRYSEAGTSPHLVPFSRWLTGRQLASRPPPLDAPALGATATLLPRHTSVRAICRRGERVCPFAGCRGASVMMRFGIRAPLEPPTVPHDTHKLHARADAGCAGHGLRPFAAVRKADAEQASTEK
jgi:hypothetical protein